MGNVVLSSHATGLFQLATFNVAAILSLIQAIHFAQDIARVL